MVLGNSLHGRALPKRHVPAAMAPGNSIGRVEHERPLLRRALVAIGGALALFAVRQESWRGPAGAAKRTQHSRGVGY